MDSSNPVHMMPGSWVDSPPRFKIDDDDSTPSTHNPTPDKPLISIMKPSEPLEPTLNPAIAQQQPFYCDLIRGFTDLIVSTYRSHHLPKIDDGQATIPGMFVLKNGGPSGEFRRLIFSSKTAEERWLSRDIASKPVIQVRANHLHRPILRLGTDFCISACPDRVLPAPVPARRMATPISAMNRFPRFPRSTGLLTPKSSPLSKMSSNRSRFMSPSSDSRRTSPPQDMHEGHSCVDIERLAREFMWWFLEWRAAIPRKMHAGVDQRLDIAVQGYIEELQHSDQVHVDAGTKAREYKQALRNLVWELQHPRETRPGAWNPSGTLLAHPWVHGDEYIHGVVGFAASSETYCIMRLASGLGCSRQDRMRRLEATNNEWRPDLFTLLKRKVAPHDDGRSIISFDMDLGIGGKRFLARERAGLEHGRKRRMLQDGRVERQDDEEDDDAKASIDESVPDTSSRIPHAPDGENENSVAEMREAQGENTKAESIKAENLNIKVEEDGYSYDPMDIDG